MTRHREGDTDYEALHEADKRTRWIRFNPEINSGTIIQILVIAAGILLGYSTLREDSSLTKARVTALEERAAKQEATTDKNNAELRADVREIGSKVSDLKGKIDLLDLKISQPRK